MSKNSMPSVLILIFLAGLSQLSETIYTPALPAIADGLGASNSLTQATLGVYFIGFALGVFYWGRLSDSLGRRPTILIGLVIYTITSFLCALVSSIYLLLMLRVIQAFGISVGSVITQTIARECYSGERRAQVFVLIGMSLAFTPAIGPFTGGYINQFFGWRMNLMALFVLGLLLLSYVFYRLPETNLNKQKKGGMRALALQMLHDKHIWGSTLIVGAINGMMFSFYAEAPFIFIDILGLSSGSYGLLGIVIAVGTALGGLSFRILTTRISQHRLCFCGLSFMIIANLAFIAVTSCFSLKTWGLPLAITSIMAPMFVLAFVGTGIFIPQILANALQHYHEKIGRAGALFGLSYYILIALFTAIMAYLHNGTINILPRYLLALTAITLFAYFGLINKTKE